MKIGFIQVTPPSVERLNCRPPQLLPAVLQHWYWNPRPVLLVLSIVIPLLVAAGGGSKLGF